MAFIEIGFNTKRPLILGRGGFGTQLNDWNPIGSTVITTPAPKRPCRRWPTGCAASTA